MSKQFPPNFNWGVATTAIQIEGGVAGEGVDKGRSMWPEFATRPGKITHGDLPDHGGRSYEFLTRDLRALEELGVRSYNFSPAWTRILPQGHGTPSQQGLDYYDRLIDGLLERGIRPDLSLYDWDLPKTYAERKGWGQRDLKERFGDYVDLLLKHYGDRVEQWMTFNEISTQATNGYKSGNHAPGYEDHQLSMEAYHHMLIAHGESVRRIRAAVPNAEVSLVDNYLWYYPATVSNEDRNAAKRQFTLNTYYLLEAVFNGRIHTDAHKFLTENHGIDFGFVREGDFDTISVPIDKFGVNYFTSFAVSDDPAQPGKNEKIAPAPGPQSPFGWTIDPVGLRMALNELRDNYTKDLPLFIGECGIGAIDYPSSDGRVHDPERIDYLYKHLEQVDYAIREDGIPVEGFYVWSLMDNYEWDNGYRKRMGLYYTKYEDPAEYLKKDSAEWFAQLCRTGQLRK